jgi:hypothetical protein
MIIPYCNWRLKCEDWRIGIIGIRRANPLTLKDSYWLALHVAQKCHKIYSVFINLRFMHFSYKNISVTCQKTRNFKKKNIKYSRKKDLKITIYFMQSYVF